MVVTKMNHFEETNGDTDADDSELDPTKGLQAVGLCAFAAVVVIALLFT